MALYDLDPGIRRGERIRGSIARLFLTFMRGDKLDNSRLTLSPR
jgi:hypothetical protein